MTDWATISSLATAGGTLVLALATFASVRSAPGSLRRHQRTRRRAVGPESPWTGALHQLLR